MGNQLQRSQASGLTLFLDVNPFLQCLESLLLTKVELNAMNGARIALDAVFIANRGDAALRVIRTARRLGLVTAVACTRAEVAQPTAAVDAADYAVLLDGPRDYHTGRGVAENDGASAPYVDKALVMAAAERFRQQLMEKRALGSLRLPSVRIAVHPGWGFLSERADFAQAVLERGFRWCGPSPLAMQVMGEKASARETMAKAQVPVVPGLRLDEGSGLSAKLDKRLTDMLAAQVGYPLILKPVYGGGGKGMRVVRQPEELARALQAARREARIACGNDTLLAERYLEQVRHIEFQVFGGYHHGVYRAVHLYERDCSVQRRHQKIVEESPAPGLSPETRARMAQCAVRAAEAVQYEGAGTVEFLYDAMHDEFFFMEMNTRLQVEHPVTEMIVRQRAPGAAERIRVSAGNLSWEDPMSVQAVDLVEWQLRVAVGEANAVAEQDELFSLAPAHAMELRLYAEAPDEQGNWLPQHGRIDRFEIDGVDIEAHSPTEALRIDSGVRTGDQVLMEFDPMIAKLIVCRADRQQAIEELRRLLDSSKIWGIATNVPFLRALLTDEQFVYGWSGLGKGVPVTWLESRLPLLLSQSREPMLVMPPAAEMPPRPDAARTDLLSDHASRVVSDSQTQVGLSQYLESEATQQAVTTTKEAEHTDLLSLEHSRRVLTAVAAWTVSEPFWSLTRPFCGFQNDGQGNRLEWFVEYPVPQGAAGRFAAESAAAFVYRVLLRLCASGEPTVSSSDKKSLDMDQTVDWQAEVAPAWPSDASTTTAEPVRVQLTQYPDDRLAVNGVLASDPLCFLELTRDDLDDAHQMQWLVRLEDGSLARVHAPLSYALWRLNQTVRPNLSEMDPLRKQAEHGASIRPGQVTSPMPGRLLEILVRQGQRVHLGDPLATLEAMKMEHTIRATTEGVITEVSDAQPGSYVPAGTLLLTIRSAQVEPTSRK